ncbi:hypothetical protein AgCh_010038 [Apium graveolens]
MPSTTGSEFELAKDSFGDDGEDDENDNMSIGGDDFVARLDARLPGAIMTEIARKLRKEADLNRKVEAMVSRLTTVEKSVAKILANQEAQNALLQQLVDAQLPTSHQLDANKKGEKDSLIPGSQGDSSSKGEKLLNIQVSKVIVPTIAFTKPPSMNSIEQLQAISSSLAKESERSSTLEGDGEGVRVVSQGEPLMQEHRENERNTGIEEIRMDIIVSESIAKDAITAMPPKAGDDVDYSTGEFEDFFGNEEGDGEEFMDIGGEAGPSSRSNNPPWVFSKECDEHHFKITLFHIIQQTHNALQATTNASTKKLLHEHLNYLQLHQI